jgi:hypothetical protein
MLVVLTALMLDGETEAFDTTPEMHLEMRVQFAAMSNTCDPGYSGIVGWTHSF